MPGANSCSSSRKHRTELPSPYCSKGWPRNWFFPTFEYRAFMMLHRKSESKYLDITRNSATGIALLFSSQTAHCKRKLSSDYKGFLTSMEAPRVDCSSHPKLPVSLLHRPSLGHTAVDCWEKQAGKARNQHSIWKRHWMLHHFSDSQTKSNRQKNEQHLS